MVALGAAVDYLEQIGMKNIAAYEDQLLQYATRALREAPGLTIIGTAAERPAFSVSCWTVRIPTMWGSCWTRRV